MSLLLPDRRPGRADVASMGRKNFQLWVSGGLREMLRVKAKEACPSESHR